MEWLITTSPCCQAVFNLEYKLVHAVGEQRNLALLGMD